MKPGNTERTLWDCDEAPAWLGTENGSPELHFARGQNGESDNHNYLQRFYTGGGKNGVFTFDALTTPGQDEFRYLRNDSYTDLGSTSNTIQVGTAVKQYHLDGQGSVLALTRKSWGGYNFHQNQYWTDAWGKTNAPVDSGRIRRQAGATIPR